MTRTPEAGGDVEAGERLAPVSRRVDRALEQLLAEELEGVGADAAAAVRHAVLSPGKRIRPLLLLGARAAAGGEDGPGADRLACSVELVHAYSLVHDDLPCMDDDVLRRGRPTVHVRFAVPTAVAAGAALMPLAVRAVLGGAASLGLDPVARRRLVATLTRASGAGGMVGGQLRDLAAEGHRVDRAGLEAIHAGKTAALLEAAARMGALSARAPHELEERLGRFGHTLGLAFQAVDDILDVTGDAEQLGKTGGRDRALGKATYPSVLGLERARRVARALAEEARSELAGLEGAGLLADVATYAVERER